ncbi:MAG TPA: mechanosensitive ion channel protein MscS, partial [Rhodobacteraceae bacterium]|nr:mechanosensitive ion channel protein MscS [Paracoccaceae bacterium]
MDGQPEIVQQVLGYVNQGWELAQGWLLSPAAWSQFGLLVAAFLAALVVSRKLSPILTKTITPPEGQSSYLAQARRFVLMFLPLLLPLLAYAFTGIGEQITRSLFGSGAVIAFGKRVFLFLAARALVRDIITDSFLKMLGKYILIPAMALYALGLLDDLTAYLSATVISLGNISFSIMALVRGVIAGSILFWLGRWSNDQSAALISKQEEMRPATRQLAVKATEITIFGVAFLLLMNIMGI